MRWGSGTGREGEYDDRTEGAGDGYADRGWRLGHAPGPGKRMSWEGIFPSSATSLALDGYWMEGICDIWFDMDNKLWGIVYAWIRRGTLGIIWWIGRLG